MTLTFFFSFLISQIFQRNLKRHMFFNAWLSIFKKYPIFENSQHITGKDSLKYTRHLFLRSQGDQLLLTYARLCSNCYYQKIQINLDKVPNVILVNSIIGLEKICFSKIVCNEAV